MIKVIMGVPGSGKTTLKKYLIEHDNSVGHSYDDIPGAREPGTPYEKIYKILIDNVRTDLNNGKNVVIDSVFLHVFERKQLLADLNNISCRKELYVMTTPLDECLRRNAKRTGRSRLPDFVITQSYEMFEMPSMDEGWDEIYIVKET